MSSGKWRPLCLGLNVLRVIMKRVCENIEALPPGHYEPGSYIKQLLYDCTTTQTQPGRNETTLSKVDISAKMTILRWIKNYLLKDVLKRNHCNVSPTGSISIQCNVFDPVPILKNTMSRGTRKYIINLPYTMEYRSPQTFHRRHRNMLRW